MKQIIKLNFVGLFLIKIIYYLLIYFMYLIINVEDKLDSKSLANASLSEDVIFFISYLLGIVFLYFYFKKYKKTIGLNYFISVSILFIIHYFFDFRELIYLIAENLDYKVKIILAGLISIIGYLATNKLLKVNNSN